VLVLFWWEVDSKKRTELHYLEEARRASSIFPRGPLVSHERPDFLPPGARLGIEVTELCREAPRAVDGRLRKVPEKARARYNRLPGAKPVNVSPAFSRHAEHLSINALAESLADFVYAHRGANEGFTRDLPEGYCHIGVFDDSLVPATQGSWRYFSAFDTVLAPKALIESRIAAKNSHISAYRAAAPQAWLLIINDQFLGPGEVCVRPEHLAQWTFDFDFDKVFLFVREPGGQGDVIELQRN